MDDLRKIFPWPRSGETRQRARSTASLGLALGLLAFGALPARADVKPFEATFTVTYHGFDAGKSVFQLRRGEDGGLEYVSRANAQGVFRLFLSGQITQRSWMQRGPDGVRPVRYRGDDGTPKTNRDIQYDFDWSANRVTGVDEDVPVDLALTPRVQDPMSAQVALMFDLSEGRKPRDYDLPDKDKLETYAYTSAGTDHLKTPAGEIDAQVYVSRREGAKHSIRIWIAPSLGYVPVQAEQRREDKRVWIMRLEKLTTDEAARPVEHR